MSIGDVDEYGYVLVGVLGYNQDTGIHKYEVYYNPGSKKYEFFFGGTDRIAFRASSLKSAKKWAIKKKMNTVYEDKPYVHIAGINKLTRWMEEHELDERQ